MNEEQAAAAAAPSDARDEAARLQKAARAIMHVHSMGRSKEGYFMRRVVSSLKYRQKWIKKTFSQITEDTANGKCSEVPGAGVVPPWVPADVRSWHPTLMDALRAKMREEGKFDQGELDAKYLIAAVVRTLDARGHTHCHLRTRRRARRQGSGLLMTLLKGLVRLYRRCDRSRKS